MRIQGRAQSLRPDPGLPDDLAPFLDVGLDLRGEVVGRGADGLVAKRRELHPDVRERDDAIDLAIEQRDDLAWRSRRGDDGKPALALDAGIAGFRHGGYVRQDLCPRA